MAETTLYCNDCLEVLRGLPEKSVDLIVTDPPYQIDNTTAGGHSALARSIQGMNDEIRNANLCDGFNESVLSEMMRIMKAPNIYIWCNAKQIPMYLQYFVMERGCNFDILIWHKQNATPLFNNKYLTDKEYCLYFRRGGYCQPESYELAKTVFTQPINMKDKALYKHPTIKPLNIIETLVGNSSREDEVICDPFMGSGTTGVAAVKANRNFIGIELNPEYYKIAEKRINAAKSQLSLF